MGERKGQNKYYPPDFDPKKHKSLNGYHGTHALRERARKLDQGILIIRFEMPYNIWCLGCNAHIAMGVRYNAEKRKVGAYLSTPIHEFKMKCHLCDQHFEIRTDPKNMDYVIMSGARRKEQRWDSAENGQIITQEREDIKRLAADPMFGLEHQVNDVEKAAKLMPTLSELEDAKSDWKDDYNLNSLMRNVLRSEKKELNEKLKQDQKFLDKWNLNIRLEKEHKDDIKLASLYKFNETSQNEDSNNSKRKIIETESIFNSSHSNKETDKSQTDIKRKKMDFLSKQISKSCQEKIISTTGFGVKRNEEISAQKTSIVIKKQNPTVETKPAKETDSATKIGLVSNDYDSD